jgi:hypothetical protein
LRNATGGRKEKFNEVGVATQEGAMEPSLGGGIEVSHRSISSMKKARGLSRMEKASRRDIRLLPARD